MSVKFPVELTIDPIIKQSDYSDVIFSSQACLFYQKLFETEIAISCESSCEERYIFIWQCVKMVAIIAQIDGDDCNVDRWY